MTGDGDGVKLYPVRGILAAISRKDQVDRVEVRSQDVKIQRPQPYFFGKGAGLSLCWRMNRIRSARFSADLMPAKDILVFLI